MELEVEYLAEKKIILTNVSGTLSPKDFRRVISEQRRIADEKKTSRYLTDIREADISLTTIGVLDLAKIYEEMEVSHLSKQAYLTADTRLDVSFIETIFYNRGWTVSFFKDMGEAEAWLTKD